MIFVPDVTQGNEDARSVRDFILLCFWSKSGELGGRGSPRFSCLAPVIESFSSHPLRAIITNWAELHLKFRQTSPMELFRENS